MNKLLGLFLPFLMVSSVWAEEKVRLEEVVITATKMEESVEETTSSVTVIKKEEIEKMNVEFVPDVLRKVSDLIVRQNGGPGTQITVFLRGGNPSQTLVMIDGIKVNNPATGYFDFSGISADNIERIEIVKGPQSTIYGSEAMAGVINIITRKGDGKARVEFSAEGGSFGTFKPSMTVLGGAKYIDYRLTGTYFYSDGFSSAKAGDERDGYKNASVSGKVDIKPSDIFDVEVTGSHYYDRIELDDFIFGKKAVDNPDFVQHGYHDLLSARTRLYLFNKWEQVLTTSLFDETLRFRDPDPAKTFNNADIKTSTETVDWQNNIYLSSYYTLTTGVEYRHETDENKGQFDRTVENKAVYLNNILKLFSERLVLNAGLRHDEHEAFGGKTTYRVGAVYAPKDADMRIKGSYGTGFRAPKFNELFYPFYGNPDLRPEESSSWEIGAEKDLLGKRLTASLTYFDQTYKNLIDTDPLSFTAANIAHSEIRGIEASTAFKVSDNVQVTASYTYLDTEDKDTGNPLPFRPKAKVSAGVEYSTKDFSAVVSYVFLSKRFDSLVQRDLGSYSLVNLAGTYRLNNWISLFTRIDNLFDARYEEVGSFRTPGFSVFGGVKLTSL